MSETFITNQMCRLVFRRSALLVNVPYGKISPDSNVLIIYKYYKQIREDVSEWYDEIFSY